MFVNKITVPFDTIKKDLHKRKREAQTASMRIMASLTELQPYSNRRMSPSIIAGITCRTHVKNQMIRAKKMPGKPFETVLVYKVSSVTGNIQVTRRLMTMATEDEDNFTHRLNNELLNLPKHPILKLVLGTGAGILVPPVALAGLVFTGITTALDLSKTSQRILARGGDEIWQVEELGKKNNKLTHISSFFLYDPYRTKDQNCKIKGWLIHEERTELDIVRLIELESMGAI